MLVYKNLKLFNGSTIYVVVLELDMFCILGGGAGGLQKIEEKII